MTLFLNPRATPAQRLGAIASVVLALTGHAALAATPDADGGVTGLRQLATGRAVGLGSAAVPIACPGADATAEVNELLKAPWRADTAVRIDLLNNPAGRRRWPEPASTFQTPRATFIRPSSRPGKT